MQDIFIDGVPFLAVSHHDGRFIHAAGLFAFARRDADGGYTILHFELSGAIDRGAGPDHPRWTWSLSEGLNTLLVHLAGKPARMADTQTLARAPQIRWHQLAQAPFGEAEAICGEAERA
jgi:hypothetical protein